MKTKHTPEPWGGFYSRYSIKGRLRFLKKALLGGGSHLIATKNAHLDNIKDRQIVCLLSDDDGYNETDRHNGRRILDCVNACAGMDDPAKEIAEMRAELNRLKEKQ